MDPERPDLSVGPFFIFMGDAWTLDAGFVFVASVCTAAEYRRYGEIYCE